MFKDYATLNQPPQLKTKRLLLTKLYQDDDDGGSGSVYDIKQQKQFEIDCQRIELLAGDERVALKTQHIPHPYPPGSAKEWISFHKQGWKSGNDLTLAIKLNQFDDQPPLLIGVITVFVRDDKIYLGYWIGEPYWNNGYTTEAALAILDFIFNGITLDKTTNTTPVIWATCLFDNIASERVFQKIGMKYQYTEPLDIRGTMIDCKFYNISYQK